MNVAEQVGQSTVKTFDAKKVRQDFPILDQNVNGQPLVYLDNAATTQKPNAVIDAISDYYRGYNSNVHRGAHSLSDKATAVFEAARETVATFVNSPKKEQIIWTRGTTEAVNLVAHSWGRANIAAGDKILVSTLEHHSNIVPWQMLAQDKGASLIPIPVSEKGEIDLQAFAALLDSRVKIVSIGHVSNALGTINPVKDIIAEAKKIGAKVFVDGAQAVAHFPVDVQSLNCDFYGFSGHKLFGPTGIGVLWGREELLNEMPPYHGGGEMIETCSFAGTTYNQLPYKFEAGTPDIAGAIGLAAAIQYLQCFDRDEVSAHEHDLLEYCHQRAATCEGLKRVGEAKNIAGVFSFLLEGAHPSDVGMLLDQQGVAVRTGHHCAQPLMDALHIPGTVRASFSIYNTRDDVDRLFAALEKVKQFL
ncbi:aminotransferase class V-fold PLP-dependent enzyme [Teredinibacter haidensis]|uniref:aminotransferase class V-fold PLP-dependent enzyme n=1 Tax=Teredinibacter haidensis TaxID=2731755 RepID=UPI0009491AA7|nr:cysteine desulfurase [Teredinibacter haidensis]